MFNIPNQHVNQVWERPRRGSGAIPKHPFFRLKKYFMLLSKALSQKEPLRSILLARLPSYRGRGINRNTAFIAKIENRQGDRSKHFPHQGERECARRRAA